jgi:AcrR family transcriptional regulator
MSIHIRGDGMVRKKVQTEIRKEQIAQAALMLIADHGLENVSIASIARMLGLVPSAIYRHYASKQEIIAAALQHIISQFQSNIDEAARETPNTLDQLERFLDKQLVIIRQIRALPRVFFASEAFLDQISGKLSNPYSIMKLNLSRLASIVKTGQARGEIRSELDPETVAVMILGLVTPAMILWHLSKGAFDVTRQVKKSWSILKSAIEPSLNCSGDCEL